MVIRMIMNFTKADKFDRINDGIAAQNKGIAKLKMFNGYMWDDVENTTNTTYDLNKGIAGFIIDGDNKIPISAKVMIYNNRFANTEIQITKLLKLFDEYEYIYILGINNHLIYTNNFIRLYKIKKKDLFVLRDKKLISENKYGDKRYAIMIRPKSLLIDNFDKSWKEPYDKLKVNEYFNKHYPNYWNNNLLDFML